MPRTKQTPRITMGSNNALAAIVSPVAGVTDFPTLKLMSEDGSVLKELVRRGTIPQSAKPLEAFKLPFVFPRFQKYGLDKFRTALNKVKRQFRTSQNGMTLDVAECAIDILAFDIDNKYSLCLSFFICFIGTDAVDHSSSHPPSKWMKMEDVDLTDGDDDDDEPIEEQEWRPIHWASQWNEFQTRKQYYTVVILLPSGVATTNNQNVKLSLEDDDSTFVVKCIWPSMIQASGLAELHSWKPAAEQVGDVNFTLRLVALDSVMGAIKDNLGGSIASVFRFELPAKVIPKYEKHWIRNAEGARILYVDFCKEEVHLVKPKVEEEVVENFEETGLIGATKDPGDDKN